MSSVMIQCPTTGRAVYTAIEMELGVFNRLPNAVGRMRCSACGREHIWAVAAAWLADGPRPLDGKVAPALVRPPGSEAA